MNGSKNVEKITTSKRLAWNEEGEPRKGSKRNKTQHGNSDKRNWATEE